MSNSSQTQNSHPSSASLDPQEETIILRGAPEYAEWALHVVKEYRLDMMDASHGWVIANHAKGLLGYMRRTKTGFSIS
jgi:hypothetical protein